MQEEKEVDKHSGKPLSEEELKEWEQAFSDIEEVSKNLIVVEG